MLDYWAPYIYCESDTFVGFILINLIVFFYIRIWWIIGGITWKSGQVYLTFLLVYGFNEENFIHYTLSNAFAQQRPLCTFTSNAFQRDGRSHAMPSIEAQLSFSIAAFLILHMFLTQQLARFRATVVISIFPILAIASLYVTRNNTAAQLAAGAALGTFNGVRRVLLYHFFFKHSIVSLNRYPIFGLFIPNTPVTITKYEDPDDLEVELFEPTLDTLG